MMMHHVATGWRGPCALRRRVLAFDGRQSLCGEAQQVGCVAPVTLTGGGVIDARDGQWGTVCDLCVRCSPFVRYAARSHWCCANGVSCRPRYARATRGRVAQWRIEESRCVFVLRGGYLCAARRAEPIVFFEPFKLPFWEKLKGSKLLRGKQGRSDVSPSHVSL